ncbi:MAG TPA: ATP-binding protein [Prolixibacteraceae bacterium]|nr:ATP-binding protein [Prolixibacteraceae bacterium]
MLIDNKINRIVVTGPESTGKTELAQALAAKLNSVWIPEYARQYVENLNRSYEYDDVIQIAQHQVEQEAAYDLKIGDGIIIFDTWLIITKVWLDLVYGKCPDWISEHIRSSKIDLFLVCDTDLPWIADPVRENGGEKRKELFQLYCNEIVTFGFKYEIISGFGVKRTENALIALSKHGLKL